MDQPINPAATDHLPFFITPPGHTDVLFVIIVVFLIAAILFIGNLYFQLHALPERMAHTRSKVQMELVAVLALIALFTHQHIFWIAALLLALVDLPDFASPIYSMAQSLEKLSGRRAVIEPTPVIVSEEPLNAAEAAEVAMADAAESSGVAGLPPPAPKPQQHSPGSA